MHERVAEGAAREGLDLRFDAAMAANTFDAHRLLHLALERGMQDDLKERLDAATFTGGLRVSDHASLVEVAVAAGLDADEVREVLASDRYADAVRADEAQAAAYAISGVPFYVVDGRYGISGAQPAELLAQALDTAWRERSPSPLLPVGGAAPGCDDESCAV